MKVLDAKVDWFEEYDNEPSLKVLVDRVTPLEEFVYEKKEVGGNSYFLYAEKDGDVSYFYVDPSDTRGFGGRSFQLNVKGEGVVTISGAWSSRASVANSLRFGPCVDVSITDDPEAFQRGHTFTAGAISLELAEIACRFARKYAKCDIELEHMIDEATIWNMSLSGGQARAIGHGRTAEASFVPRKKIPSPLYLNRIDMIMLKNYKILTSSQLMSDERNVDVAINLMERYFSKYYGPRWKEHMLKEEATL